MLSFRLQFSRWAVAIAVTAPALAFGGVETGIDAYSGGDYALAMHELQPLAEKGNADAEYYVGQMYENGQGVLKNEATALVWFLQSAGGGNAKAQLLLVDVYAFGRGVPENDAIAAYWRWRASTTLAATAKRDLNQSLKNVEADKKNASATPGKIKCATPSYKHDVDHFGDGGTVDMLFLVDANGKSLDTVVLNSSDWPRLDQYAHDAYVNCTFSAAKVDGKDVPGVVRLPYEWKLAK